MSSHPLQNRVSPFGDIVAVPERGTFTGNRGILHDDQRLLTRRRWSTQAWIICLLEFKGRHRAVMSPGTWTELFFLDEVTALAAGHRPCGECRREAYQRFKACWIVGNGAASIDEIDRRLHRERVEPRTHVKITYQAPLESLPDGAFVAIDGAAHLLWRGVLWRWSFGGYSDPQPVSSDRLVTVLTPRSTVAALTRGYTPIVSL